MATLKKILFGQFAGESLTSLVEEMQKKYNPKKGRRFNHANITYEVSRPGVVDDNIQFEISSKIPQDELKGNHDMKSYFKEIKKLVSKEKHKPVSVEMENIVLDSKKDSEKERDYVKLLYCYPLDDLYDDKDVTAKIDQMSQENIKESTQKIKGSLTPQGSLVLQMVKETIQNNARENIEQLISANKKVKAEMMG
ncbi:MAG: hypothetical protein QF913_03020 [Nitrospinaceae bacterium]|jgi:hypothetical protein|nr:hypothetical protein [Nitrospinaceae bacterium]|tara:strand:+ start:140 stop:724 length:585 start_codon:yes stop_codon:yes gene_type:complete